MSRKSPEDWMKPASVEYAIDEPEFMAEYGRAMAAWGGVEHALSSLFATVLEVKQPQWARAAFHNVISFRDKLGMIDAPAQMVTSCWPGQRWADLKLEWGRLRESASNASRHRNRLAHMHVWHGPERGTFGWNDITKISDLPLELDEMKRQAVTVNTMKDYRKSFEQCSRRIREFEKNLAEALKDPMQDAMA